MSVSTMKKLSVLAYGKDADAIVRKLMNLRCVDIRNADIPDQALESDRLHIDDEKREAEAKLSAIREALPILSQYSQRKKMFGRIVHRVDFEEFVASGKADAAAETVTRTLEVKNAQSKIQTEVTQKKNLLDALEPWRCYDLPLDALGSEKTMIQLGSYPADADVAKIESELDEICAYAEKVCEDDNGLYYSVCYLKENESEVMQLLARQGFLKQPLPPVNTTAGLAARDAERELDRLEAEYEELQKQYTQLAEGLDDVEILSDLVETTVNACQQKKKLLQTQNCVMLSGWIPEERTDALLETLSHFECATDISLPEEGDDVPVMLKNNRFASNFEWVIGMYAYPKYGTYDPTFLMSIFYFIIFGLMFADVGYGLILTALCLLGIKILNPKPSMRRMLSMFALCGISCAVMGVLFGGWFGDLPTAIMENLLHIENAKETPIGHFFSNGLIFNPIDSSMPFLVLSLGLGEVHLVTGMAIHMVEEWKHGRPLVGICSTVPYWILFAGLDLLAPQMFGGMGILHLSDSPIWAQLSSVGSTVALVGILSIFLFKGVGQKNFIGWLVGGLGGLYSLISYASDLLSYSRILALGLVAGVIAQVINLLTSLGSTGVVGFIVMLIVLIGGHLLNIAINLLGTFVHAARLQYIEFFGKFYEDGGTPFEPAVPADEFTEQI